ncbi:hypothetical protein QZN11_30585 [Streptomyces gramineus]|uniref:hypothetical protein n=1 Tax=Streptomyces gramineus TaxID=910542 RepID=UPI00398AA376
MVYQGNAYTDQVREGLRETWQQEAYGQSWGALRERLRYSSDASWDPYFEAFNEEHRELLDLPGDVGWEEHREEALDVFVRWLDEHVDWQLLASRTADGGTADHAWDQGQDQWGHGVEQDMSAETSWQGYADASQGHADASWRYSEEPSPAHHDGYGSGTPAGWDTAGTSAGQFAGETTGYPEVSAPPAADGPVDPELAREALQIFASSTDDPSVLTDEHLAVLQAMPIEVEEDVSGPPHFED